MMVDDDDDDDDDDDNDDAKRRSAKHFWVNDISLSHETLKALQQNGEVTLDHPTTRSFQVGWFSHLAVLQGSKGNLKWKGYVWGKQVEKDPILSLPLKKQTLHTHTKITSILSLSAFFRPQRGPPAVRRS